MRIIRGKFGKSLKAFATISRTNSILKFSLPLGCMFKKTKKDPNLNFQNVKNTKRTFVITIKNKIPEKFDKFRLRYVKAVFFGNRIFGKKKSQKRAEIQFLTQHKTDSA